MVLAGQHDNVARDIFSAVERHYWLRLNMEQLDYIYYRSLTITK